MKKNSTRAMESSKTFKRGKNNYTGKSSSPVSVAGNDILHLQRTLGNATVQRLYETGQIQAKLKIGQPGDKYEREADSVADRVMSMSEPASSPENGSVQRACCESCEEKELKRKPLAESITPLVQREAASEEEEEVQRQAEEEEEVQGKFLQRETEEDEELQKQPEEENESVQTKDDGGTPSVSPSVESGINSLRGSGQPLPESTRSFMEPRFGADFSGVRVHTDSNANHLARSINAKAFTVGKDVVFGSGQYAPETSGGKQLLAHELTHTVQQATLANNKGLNRQFLQRDGALITDEPPKSAWEELVDKCTGGCWTDGGHWCGSGPEPNCFQKRTAESSTKLILFWPSDECVDKFRDQQSKISERLGYIAGLMTAYVTKGSAFAVQAGSGVGAAWLINQIPKLKIHRGDKLTIEMGLSYSESAHPWGKKKLSFFTRWTMVDEKGREKGRNTNISGSRDISDLGRSNRENLYQAIKKSPYRDTKRTITCPNASVLTTGDPFGNK